MPLMLKRTRAMLASGGYPIAPAAERPPVLETGDAPVPSTSDLVEKKEVVVDPPKDKQEMVPPSPTPVEPLPVEEPVSAPTPPACYVHR